MPWTAENYRSRHNKKLTTHEAGKAAAQATAMIDRGVPEGEAIATANKAADRRQSRYGNPPKRN